MEAPIKRPLSLNICRILVRAAASLVPAEKREAWRQEWFAELWHRWQFLYHIGAWNWREQVGLFRDSLGAFPDAAWHFASQDQVQRRVRECTRSPWTCLAVLSLSLVLVALFSSGLTSTRALFPGHRSPDTSRLLFVWYHPVIGSGDKELPSDVVPAWSKHSRLVEGVAAFHITHALLSAPGVRNAKLPVIHTEPELFRLLNAHPAAGNLAEEGLVLNHQAWKQFFRADPRLLGSQVNVGAETYRVTAILPAQFQFLSRQPLAYLVQPRILDAHVMVVARSRPGVTDSQLDRELTKIAEDSAYYFFRSQLRLNFVDSAVLIPLRFFALAVFAAAALLITVARVRLRHVRLAWRAQDRAATLRRGAFFAAKTGLALALVFVAGLEWSRSESAILLGSQDPASGPFLVWLYIVGAMGVMFWSLADQRARCRVCLRLLCFPVRIGCPGCLLLDWSGTELFCTEGHGVLHVPHLSASWDEESDRWISLDESWRDLFAHTE